MSECAAGLRIRVARRGGKALEQLIVEGCCMYRCPNQECSRYGVVTPQHLMAHAGLIPPGSPRAACASCLMWLEPLSDLEMLALAGKVEGGENE